MAVPFVSVPWVIVLFSLAFFGQQSWSTLVMILPTDLFPKRAVGTVAGLVGLGGAMGGVVMGQLAGYLLDHGFSYIPVLAISGSLHVCAFVLILLTAPSIRPLIVDSPAGLEVVGVK
jgi:ACS family hexuronate transporter-like MFS transporter